MKTDGETFVYNQEEEKPEIPEAVSEVKLLEVKATTLDVPLDVEGEQIGHCRLERQASGDFDKEKWKKEVELITPVLARIIKFVELCRPHLMLTDVGRDVSITRSQLIQLLLETILTI